MMNIMLRSQDKASILLALFYLMVLLHKSGATNFSVGGSSGWRVPPDNTNMYNQWAERNRFQIGDSLVFDYQANQDSVLRVTKESYDSCNTNTPLESFKDGHTSYTLNQSGHFYFISGNKDNCLKNEKIWVIVMAKRSSATSHQVTSPPYGTQVPPPSPLAPNGTEVPPSSPLTPNGTEAPPPSPLAPNGTAASPPAPAGEIAPSPPPIGMETPPALEPYPSAASSLCVSFIGFFCTSVASSLLMV